MTFDGTVMTCSHPLLLVEASTWILQKKFEVDSTIEGKRLDLTYLSGKHISLITGNTIILLYVVVRVESNKKQYFNKTFCT